MKRTIAYILSCVCLCLMLTACGGSKLAGTWSQTKDQSTTSMVFRDDLTGTLFKDGQPQYNFIYEIKGKLVTITTRSETDNVINEYLYKVKNDTLTLEKPNGEQIQLTRDTESE